jgi:hypothetical protein
MATHSWFVPLAQLSLHVQKPGGGGVGAVEPAQLPLTQLTPSGQMTPQPPQLRMSLDRLMQPLVPQQVWPVPHGSPNGGQPHLPPRQMAPSGQTVPHAPQLRGSRPTSMHSWPQQVSAHAAPLSVHVLPPSPDDFSPLRSLTAQPATVSERNRRIPRATNVRATRRR